jgi:hypothetical protein
MKKKKLSEVWILLMLALVVLTACGGATGVYTGKVESVEPIDGGCMVTFYERHGEEFVWSGVPDVCDELVVGKMHILEVEDGVIQNAVY